MEQVEIEDFEWKRPSYRFALRALIISKGFRTVSEFAKSLGTPIPRVAKVVCGWEYPGPTLAKKMADALSINLETMEKLIHEEITRVHSA